MTIDLTLDEGVKTSLPSGTVFEETRIALPVLYKRTSKGDFQQSAMRVDWKDTPQPIITTTHGKVDGKLRDSIKEIFEAKSQSSIWNQAVFNVRSMWQKKLDGAYSLGMTDKKEFRPTLAKKLHKYIHIVKKEQEKGGLIFVSGKLNGIRGGCLENEESGQHILQSRTGKDISKGNSHIVKCYSEYFSEYRCVLDGELYAHGKSLQEISGSARRSADSTDLKFYVYDVYWLDQPDLSYSDRFFFNPIHDLIRKLGAEGLPIDSIESLVETEVISAHEEDFEAAIEAAHVRLSGPEKDKEDNGLGFEGVIVRLDSFPYKLNGHSTGLLKKKWFIDDEYEIVDVWTPKTGVMKGQAMFKVQGHAFGKPSEPMVEFDQTPMGDFATREAYLADKDNLIGKKVTVKFTEYTNIGIPLHGNAVAIRDYE